MKLSFKVSSFRKRPHRVLGPSFTEFLWREDVWQNFPLSPQQQSFSFKTKEVKKELSLFLLFLLLWSMEKSEKWLRKIREIREKSFLNNLQMNFEWDSLSDFQTLCIPIQHFFIKNLKRMNIQKKTEKSDVVSSLFQG